MLLLILGGIMGEVAAQGVVRGIVLDQLTGAPVEWANCYLKKSSSLTETGSDGSFQLDITPGLTDTLQINRLGYKEAIFTVGPITDTEILTLEIQLAPVESDVEIIVTDKRESLSGQVTQDIKVLENIPTTTGNIESLLPYLALGAQSTTGGELSSQYNVRGGNFDENIVYVNGFEIYRPQLLSNSQQEGLSFANVDLVQSLSFSSGGFSARYGDKSSSVLDIQYKVPDSTAASLSFSLLGGSFHVEGASKNKKFRYLTGARYKTTTYLLNSTQTKGEYLPTFLDVQGYFSYDITPKTQLYYMTNFNQSIFDFEPVTSSETTGGLIGGTRRFQVEYDGRERDRFTSVFNGVGLAWNNLKEVRKSFVKAQVSLSNLYERENFDIGGNYALYEVNISLSQSTGDNQYRIGGGRFQEYNKKYFEAAIPSAQVYGGTEFVKHNNDFKLVSHFVNWGAGAKLEDTRDFAIVWERQDSAGMTLPYREDSLLLTSAYQGSNQLETFKGLFYTTYTYSNITDRVAEIKAEAGIRAHYWEYADEFFVNPRASFLYKPLSWDKDLSFKLASGLYYQPGFYRDMLLRNRTYNPDIVSQKSFHLLGGLTWDFRSKGGTPFRIITEAYYKSMWDQISYDVDNVRITYSGLNDSRAYAYGLDVRLNGELIKNAESWINFSYLKTEENLDLATYYPQEGETESGWVPRPTDRRINFALFIQDYYKDKENLKMHMKLIAGSGLPYGFPRNNYVNRNAFRYGGYYRVDLGLSFVLYDRLQNPRNSFLSFTKRTWFSVEVFNLLNNNNHASNTWVKDVFNVYHPIRNRLTGRRINLRFRIDF